MKSRQTAFQVGAVQCSSSGDFYREIARRIVAGYTEPNFWTREAIAA